MVIISSCYIITTILQQKYGLRGRTITYLHCILYYIYITCQPVCYRVDNLFHTYLYYTLCYVCITCRPVCCRAEVFILLYIVTSQLFKGHEYSYILYHRCYLTLYFICISKLGVAGIKPAPFLYVILFRRKQWPVWPARKVPAPERREFFVSIKGRAVGLLCLSCWRAFVKNTSILKPLLVFFTYLAQSRLTQSRTDLPSREPA